MNISDMRSTATTLTAVVFALLSSAPGLAQEPAADVERGRTLAQTNCATCHAIGSSGNSPLEAAPPFRTLHHNYPVEQLGELFIEGVAPPHSAMPDFHLDQDESNDMVAYLKSLEN